jgi:hypothetical protein
MDNDIDGSSGGRASVLAPELSSLSDDQLTVGYDVALAASRQAEWARLAYESEIDRRRMYSEDGTGSLREWICIRTGEGDRAAYHQARIARTLGTYPRLSEALADGRVSTAHVRYLLVLPRLTDLDDDGLVASGETHTVPQLEAVCRAARPVSPADDDNGHRQRHLRWRYDDKGTLRLRGQLQGPEALSVTNLIAAMAETAVPDPATGMADSFDTRCADALVDLCTNQINDSTARRAELVIHVPIDALPGAADPDEPGPDGPGQDEPGDEPNGNDPYGHWLGGFDRVGPDSGRAAAGGAAMSWDGTVLSTAAFQRLLCDSKLRLIADDARGRAVGIGFRSQTIPHWLAGQLRWRDGSCRFPGCERTRWLHGHHVVHWPHGPTNLGNLLELCGAHHRLVHEGGWHVTGDPNSELTFTSPAGNRYATRPATRRIHRPPPRPSDNGP